MFEALSEANYNAKPVLRPGNVKANSVDRGFSLQRGLDCGVGLSGSAVAFCACAFARSRSQGNELAAENPIENQIQAGVSEICFSSQRPKLAFR